MSDDDNTVPLALYSAALDEIWNLRRAMAYEALVAQAHGEYKTFPKSRRASLDAQVERMRESARGRVEVAYADRSYRSMDHATREAGAPLALTRSSWEAERPAPGGAA